MRVGDKRLLKLVLKTDAPLGLLAAKIRFDPRVLAVNTVSQGNLFAGMNGAPTITPNVEAEGLLLLAVTPPSGEPSITGAGVLLLIEVEAVGVGMSSFAFRRIGRAPHHLRRAQRHGQSDARSDYSPISPRKFPTFAVSSKMTRPEAFALPALFVHGIRRASSPLEVIDDHAPGLVFPCAPVLAGDNRSTSMTESQQPCRTPV